MTLHEKLQSHKGGLQEGDREVTGRPAWLYEKLQSHKGGLLHINSELYWFGCRRWDGISERLCLVLDAAITAPKPAKVAARVRQPVMYTPQPAADQRAVAHLLIDGEAHWVWVLEKYVELIDEAR